MTTHVCLPLLDPPSAVAHVVEEVLLPAAYASVVAPPPTEAPPTAAATGTLASMAVLASSLVAALFML